MKQEDQNRLNDSASSSEKPLQSWKEIASYLEGVLTLEDAIRDIQRLSRVYVRRQANWFKLNDPEIHWFDVSSSTNYELLALISQFHHGTN